MKATISTYQSMVSCFVMNVIAICFLISGSYAVNANKGETTKWTNHSIYFSKGQFSILWHYKRVVKVYAPLNRRSIITLNTYMFLCVRGKKNSTNIDLRFCSLKKCQKTFPSCSWSYRIASVSAILPRKWFSLIQEHSGSKRRPTDFILIIYQS